MIDREDFNKMIKLYQKVMIEPLVNGEITYKHLERDEYDKIEAIHFYNPTDYSVRFGAVRKRPDRYAIDKMHCVLADVHIFDIERWYDEYSTIIEKSNKWEWEY
jgi:hypothetical protein